MTTCANSAFRINGSYNRQKASIADQRYSPLATLAINKSSYVPSMPNQQCSLNCTRVLVCYTPVESDAYSRTLSCLKTKSDRKAVLTTDGRLAVVPAGAIIDRVEFFGFDDFNVKDCFYIGLGQLNDGIVFPLVHGATAEIANEKIGGCVDFLSTKIDGKTDKSVVAYDSNLNVSFDHGLASGSLAIRVYYRMRMEL